LQRAIELNPSYTDTLNNLAVALIMEKRYDEAHKVLADLNQLDSKDGYGKENLEILEKMCKEVFIPEGKEFHLLVSLHYRALIL